MPVAVPDQEKLARYRAFWQRASTDRPLLGATISTFPSVRAIRGDGILSPDDLDLAANLRELDEEWEAWRAVGGDVVWAAHPLWAFPWHLAMAGCPIRRDADILWALPAVADWDELDRVRLAPDDPWLRRLLKFSAALAEHSRGRYPVGTGQLMLGPVDMMMQVRGQERLALDLHDAPARVEELGRRCLELCAAALAAQYRVVQPHLGGRAGTIRYLWAPGELVETAEDASFMASPAAHRRFIAPLHRELGRRFPYTIVHLHSAQLHTVAGLLEIDEVAAVEITPDFGEDMLPHLPLLARILERKPLIVHGVMPVDAMQEMTRSLPAAGLCLFRRCDSPEQAAATLDALGL